MQVTCHLLMLLLSARACSEIAQQNSVSLEIPFEEILHYLWVVSFSLGAGFLLISSTYTVLLCSLSSGS